MSHYLSRITVPASAAVCESDVMIAGNAYRDHRLMWKLFPDAPDAKRDFLFRAEQGANGHLLYYLLSQRPPQAWHSAVRVESKPYRPELDAGEWVHFSLRANPVVARPKEKGQRSQRHDVMMAAKTEARAKGLSPGDTQAAMTGAALDWLTRRAGAWGWKSMSTKCRWTLIFSMCCTARGAGCASPPSTIRAWPGWLMATSWRRRCWGSPPSRRIPAWAMPWALVAACCW
ncbi:CRISPR-associated protein Cas6/Cse3/CasE, subtype I-E/ECOLI [Chromobacterium vaccinii]|nr:type I-E CRISPR-associated protein Cas6/Cse3/CasE [Chromobacterium vaccinii]SUX30013.1 CRISPR-associated protein Cas6/Cse3/CasE, subtype I-E/ECOLI [Chromobacterium vaccinii]